MDISLKSKILKYLGAPEDHMVVGTDVRRGKLRLKGAGFGDLYVLTVRTSVPIFLFPH